MSKKVRQFETGASRDSDTGKHDPDGFRHPLTEDSFYAYMHGHRTLGDGTVRGSDNWWSGLPAGESLKSLKRHLHDLSLIMHGYKAVRPETGEVITAEDALNAIEFNAASIKLELLSGRYFPPKPRGDE